MDEPRIDLQGNIVGVVSEEEALSAKTELKAARARQSRTK
jgi:sRNA-binding protein